MSEQRQRHHCGVFVTNFEHIFKVNNKGTLTSMTHSSGAFTATSFDHISNFLLVFCLLTLNKQKLSGKIISDKDFVESN